MKQITPEGHGSWGNDAEYAPLTHLRRVSRRLKYFYSNFCQSGFQSRSWEVEILRSRSLPCMWNPGAAGRKWTRVHRNGKDKGMRWDSQSIYYEPLLDAILTRLFLDWMCFLGKLLLCISHSVPAPLIWLHTWGSVCRYSGLIKTKNRFLCLN